MNIFNKLAEINKNNKTVIQIKYYINTVSQFPIKYYINTVSQFPIADSKN